jgi:hypothetical protein
MLSPNGTSRHLSFTPVEPVLTGGTLAVSFMSLPGCELVIGNLTAVLLNGVRKPDAFGDNGNRLPDRYQPSWSRPAGALIVKVSSFPTGPPVNGSPGLTRQPS